MSRHEEPAVYLQEQEPGTTILARFAYREDRPEQQCLLTRCTSEALDEIPENPSVRIRAGAFVREGVGCVPLLIRIEADEEDRILDAWIDICDGYPRRKNPLLDLRKQEVIPLLFIQDNEEPDRVEFVVNSVDWDEIKEQMPQLQWSTDDYQRVRKTIKDEYPTMFALWRALKNRS